MSNQTLDICILSDGDGEALMRTLAAVSAWPGHGRIRIHSLQALPAAVTEDLPEDLELLSGDWQGSMAQLWRQALAGEADVAEAESGRLWLLLEAGECPDPESLGRLAAQPGSALVAIRRGETLEHSPRLLARQDVARLQGRVYPRLEYPDAEAETGLPYSGVSLAAAQGLGCHQPQARITWLEGLRAEGAQDVDLLYELGNLYFRAQQDQAALDCFEPLAQGPEGSFWTLAGRVMELKTRWELNQRERVLDALERYRAQNPTIEWVPGLWVLRGVIARQLQEPDLAMECFQQVRELVARPGFATRNPVVALPDVSWKPLLGLAEVQLSQGLFSLAWLNFSKVREELPGNDYIATELLKASFFIHRYDTIRELLATGTPLRGISASTRRMLEGMLLLKDGSLEAKARIADYGPLASEAELIQSDPFLVSVMLEFAIALLRSGCTGQARSLLLELSARMPDQPVIWHNLAYTYFVEADYALAERYYRRALSCDANFHESRFDLAKVLVMQQHRDQALLEFYELRRLQPHDQRVKQAIRQLEPQEIDAFVPPARQPDSVDSQMPYIFVFPLSPEWENGADIALKAFYQEFVGEDQVVLAFPLAAENEILASARAWAEARYAQELLPPVALLQEPLPLLPGQSAWVLPWRLHPGEELMDSLNQSGYPAITTTMRLSQPQDQPLPVAYSAETSGERRRIWLEADVEAVANQMRLAVYGDLPARGEPGEIQTHAFVTSVGDRAAAEIAYQEPAAEAAPGVSVCMIVKDEAEMLPKCLDSIVDQADEIIVVDTGSTDATREILAGYPQVRVFDFAWSGDFAAARNYAVAQASQPWILSLDADEYLDAGFFASLAQYLNQPAQPDAYAFPVLALSPEGELDPAHSLASVPRLFPNSPDYSYRGRIHEMIYHRERSKMRYFHMQQLPIWHRGYQAAIVEAKQKNLRDTELIEGMMRDQPEAIETQRLYLVLAGLYQVQGDDDKALSCVEQGLERVRDDELVRSMLLRRRLQLLQRLGRDAEVLQLAGLASGDPYIAACRADSLRRLGRAGEALQSAREALHLAEAQALQPDPLEQQLKREDLLWDLAQLAELNGELSQALYYFKRHLKLVPSGENWKRYETLQQKLRAREETEDAR